MEIDELAIILVATNDVIELTDDDEVEVYVVAHEVMVEID